MADATQQQGSIYQMVTLTPGLADKIFGESSPQTIIDNFWEFLNSELMTANLKEFEVDEFMDRADIAMMNMITGIPEDQWNDFKIVEQEYVAGPDGKPVLRVKRIFTIVELWDQMLTKVKVKCCNARNGHLIKTVTESRSQISQLYEERGTQRVPGMSIPAQPAQEEKGSGWRPI